MTEGETRELAELRAEVASLRLKLDVLCDAMYSQPYPQVHHYYPPQAWPGTVVYPGTIPQRQWTTACAGGVGPALGTYTVNIPACPDAPTYQAQASVAAGCAPVQIYGVLP